jgi:hypothetical protein
MVRHIHQSYPQIVNMCQILEPAAESLVYHHRLSDDDDLEDVAQGLAASEQGLEARMRTTRLPAWCLKRPRRNSEEQDGQCR